MNTCLRLTKLQHSTASNIFKKTIRLSSMASSEIGPVQREIQKKITSAFAPSVVEVVNESYKHAVPRGSETHFKVLVVSAAFQGKTPIQRHRSVNALLQEELSGPVHALSIQAKTPDQWEKSDQVIGETPPCLGGSKKSS